MEKLNAVSLYILNGRSPGDLTGKFTCHKYNGISAVDYFIIEKNMFQNVIYMDVLETPWFTDHCPISLTLKISCKNMSTSSILDLDLNKTSTLKKIKSYK